MAATLINPSEPTQAEQLEMAVLQVKAQIAQRVVIETAKNYKPIDLEDAEEDAKVCVAFSASVADLVVEAFRPKLPSSLLGGN